MRRARLYLPVLVAAFGALALLVASNIGSTIRTKQAKPILVGAAVSTSGFMAPYDQPPTQAAQMAIDELNKKGGLLGRPLKLVIQNARSDINQGANAGVALLDKGADFLIVSCDFDFGGGAALEAQKRGKLAFSTCAASTKFGPQGIGPLAFTMATAAPAQASIMAEWAYNTKGWRTAYTLMDTTVDYEKQECGGFKDRWKTLPGAKLLGEDTFKQEDASIASQITRLKSLKKLPDFFMLCSYQPGGAKALRQIRAAGINIPMLSGEDWDGSYWQKAVPNVSNVYFDTYGSIFGDDPDPKVNAFFKKLKPTAPTSHAETGYTIIQAYAEAVKRAKSLDSVKVQKALETFKDVPLLTGPTSFTPQYHIQFYRSMRIIQVQKGKDSFVTVYRPKKVPIPAH